ncbi:MAG: polysaccharide deacetylase family protein [Gammaproteobacteria bacterium]
MKFKQLKQKAIYHSRIDYLTKPFYQGLGSILMFHRICDADHSPRIAGNKSLECSPELLVELINYLKKAGYHFIGLDEIPISIAKRRKKWIALTFDDGYRDNLTLAYPILKEYQVPFAIYVTNSFPNHTAILWWYLLEELLLTRDSIAFDFHGQGVIYACKTNLEKQQTFSAIRKLILREQYDHQVQTIKQIFSQFYDDLTAKTRELALSWDEIIEASKDPLVTIGAHTIDHLALSKLSEGELHRQLLQSRQELEEKLGSPIRHFAYPYGSKHEASLREFQYAREIGFETAVTTRPGNIFFQHANHMQALPRLAITENKFASKPHALRPYLHGLSFCVKNRFKRINLLSQA